MRLLPLLALALALAALPVAAQEHNHTGTATAIIAHDAPPGGRTYVGDVTSFAVVDDANHDLQPDPHQNNHIRVSLNGAVLWEASASAGHDYDGVNTFSIVFPAPGAYEVALVADDGMVQAHYNGTVEAPQRAVPATVDLQVPERATALQPVPIRLQVNSVGALLNHTDAVVEVRQGEDLLFRTHAHTHTAPMELSYTFPRQGTYTVRATGYLAYATGKGPEFAPASAERTVTVAPGVALPTLPPTAPMPLPDNVVVAGTAQGGPYKLFGTYDPYTVAGPATQMHLAALVMDPATGGTLQHVNFAATLTGPLGQVFQSSSLHEYDGIYELAAKQAVPGAYKLVVDASKGDWTGHLELPYTVALPPATSGYGKVDVTVDQPTATAGKATTLTLAARDAAGQPYQHSELDVEVIDAAGTTLLWTKLHTHGDGTFPLTFAFPAAGDYRLRVAPDALDGAPANFLDGSAAVLLPVKVGPGPGLPALTLTPSGDANQLAPGVGPLLLVALLGAAVALRRVK